MTGAADTVLYSYAAFDAKSDELIASLSIEGPADGEGVLHFAAWECGELFDRPFYLRTNLISARLYRE